MIRKPVEEMDRGELVEMVQALLWQLRLTDAFWFLKVEDRFGLASAEKLNEEVWAKVGELAARDIARRFGPFEPGVAGVLKAYGYLAWSMMVDFQAEKDGDAVVVRVPVCPAQEGRRKHGLGEYVCKHMHRREFEAFVHVIDSSVGVECVFAPPDEHPPDCDCMWRFALTADERHSEYSRNGTHVNSE